MLLNCRAKTVHGWSFAGDRPRGVVIASTCTALRHEHADCRKDDLRLLRDDEIVFVGADESGPVDGRGAACSANCRYERAGFACAAHTGKRRARARGKVRDGSACGAFAAAARALLHVSHLIYGG